MLVKKPSQKEIDTTSSWGVWTKEISSFPWEYSEKEICYILEGEAIVTAKNGEKIQFSKGDWVEFEQGLECTWEIVNPIKKRYFFE